jgi:hypothetical protein
VVKAIVEKQKAVIEKNAPKKMAGIEKISYLICHF